MKNIMSIFIIFLFIFVLLLFFRLVLNNFRKNTEIYLYTIINILTVLMFGFSTYFLNWNNITVFVLIIMLSNFLVFLTFEKIKESILE